MGRFSALVWAVIGAAIAFSLSVGAANAQASRTWVSGVGDDANPCSRTAPCKTFAGAISKTAVNGEINCLDPGGFGAVTITKSITIDCHEIVGSILNAGTAGVNVAFDSFSGADTRKTVNLRNLMIQGFDSGVIGIHLLGVGSGSRVNIEDCLINGNFSGAAGGIVDDRGQGQLNINNTTVRNMGANGISVSSSNGSTLRTVITNTRVINSTTGINAGNGAQMFLSHVVLASNSNIGLNVANGSYANVDSAVFASNTVAMQNTGTGAIRLSNSDVSFNTTAISGGITSFVSNRFTNNDTLGTITPNNVTAR